MFDGEWGCRCGGVLRIRRDRALRAVCEECGDVWTIPDGVVEDDCDCDCGLPLFRTGKGVRCLDARCDAVTAA